MLWSKLTKKSEIVQKNSGGGTNRSLTKRLLSFALFAVMMIAVAGYMPKIEVEAINQSEVSSQLSALINQYNGKTATSSQMIYGKQCKGFANWVFQKIFGVYIGPYPENANYKLSNPQAQTVGIIEPGNLNVNTSRELLQKGKPGDYIQVQRSTARGRGPHSMILVSVRSDGIEVFDCNSDGKNTIKNYIITWESFDTASRAMSLYHANNYEIAPDINIYDVNEKYRVSTSSGSNLMVRSTYSTAGSIVTQAANGAEFIISKRTSNNWGYCDSLGGWLWLDYCVQIPIETVPTYSSLSITNGHYFFNTNETINFHADSDTATNYWIGIDRDGQRVVTEQMSNGDFSISFTESGNYSAYVTSANDAGYLDSERIEFKVFSPVDTGTDFYAYIINTNAWKFLTNEGNNVSICTVTGNANQVWKFERQSDSSYKIINCQSNNLLETYSTEVVNGTGVGAWPNNDCNGQRWFIYEKPGAYYLRAICGDCVLDIPGGATEDGANVQMYELNYTTAQQFTIYRTCIHSYGSWETVKSATCTYDGQESRTCLICGEKETRSIAKIGHKYTTRVIFPTYTEKGYTLHTCNLCGDSYKDNYTDIKIKGDINNDNNANISDIVILNQFLYKYKTFAKKQYYSTADINNDGKINVFDLILLKRLIVNRK